MAKRFSVRRQRGFTFIALACFFLLYLPIATMVVYAFNAGTTLGDWQGFSFRWFTSIWQNDAIVDATIRSLTIAPIAALVATVTATMAALATTRTAPYRGMMLKYSLINQPLMVPEIVTAVALLVVFSRIKIWTGYSGIGYLMQTAGSQQRMSLAFAGLVTIGAMAMAMYEFFSWIEKRTTAWAHRGSQAA